jgi:hypothetical protein
MLANDDLGNLGRLGNQMFQYAALRGLAQKHGYQYCLPPRHVVATRDPNVVASDTTMFETFKLPEVPKRVTNFRKYWEAANCKLDMNLWDNCPDNVSLYGYFQTERYFKHIEDEIRKDFTFVDEISEPTEEFFKSEFSDGEVISLHVRRTDYLKYPDNHPVLPNDYYEISLEKMPEDLPVLVFSDDIEWCKQQKIFDSDRFLMSEGNNTAVDLYLQTRCKYHIIANSSFSWWGSWLAKSKKTIAPNTWFGVKALRDMTEFYLSDWDVI